jgi:hypothetical protein
VALMAQKAARENTRQGKGLSKLGWGTIYLCTFIGRIGDWTQGLKIARQALYHLSQAPSAFAF